MRCVYERFHEHFEVLRANSSNLLQQSLSLRYQVYCVEKGYEDPENYPRGMESDAYDLRADHHVIRHRSSSRVVGTVRIILPDSMDSSLPFPMEHVCKGAVDKDLFNPVNANRSRMGEISRFCISKELRRSLDPENPHAENNEIANFSDAEIRRLYSQIVVGLIHAVIKMSAEHELTHWLAVMEPSLSRLLKRFGFHFTPLGPPVNLHGYRRPFYAVIGDEMTRVYREYPEVWDVITESGNLWSVPQNKIYHIA